MYLVLTYVPTFCFTGDMQLVLGAAAKRGYGPLRVEELVELPPQSDPTDPLFPYQWYLKNTGQNGGKARLDLNVEAAWAQVMDN